MTRTTRPLSSSVQLFHVLGQTLRQPCVRLLVRENVFSAHIVHAQGEMTVVCNLPLISILCFETLCHIIMKFYIIMPHSKHYINFKRKPFFFFMEASLLSVFVPLKLV